MQLDLPRNKDVTHFTIAKLRNKMFYQLKTRKIDWILTSKFKAEVLNVWYAYHYQDAFSGGTRQTFAFHVWISFNSY